MYFLYRYSFHKLVQNPQLTIRILTKFSHAAILIFILKLCTAYRYVCLFLTMIVMTLHTVYIRNDKIFTHDLVITMITSQSIEIHNFFKSTTV